MIVCGVGWLLVIMLFGIVILCLMFSDEICVLLVNKNEDGGI